MTELIATTSAPAQKKGRMFSIERPGLNNNRRRYHPTEIHWNGQYWEHRFSLHWIDQLITSVPFLGSGLQVKRNYLLRSCKITRPDLLSLSTLERYIEDRLSFGIAYLEPETNRRGKLMKLHHHMTMWTREDDDGEFWWLDNRNQQPAKRMDVDMFKSFDYDRRQEIYGIPEYVAGIHAALLNQAATVFRVEFSENKGLVRFILHITADLEDDVMDEIERKFKSTRGFSIEDMLIHDPEGKPDGVKLIPILGDISKDDFLNVNKISGDSVGAALRVPHQLLARSPDVNGGFGNVLQAAQAFVESEIIPLHARVITPLNAEFGDLIEFEPISFAMPTIAHNATPTEK